MDLIIFDCDGVLIDSEWIACRVEAEMLTEAGFPITTEEVIRRFAGKGPESMKAALAEQFGRPLPADLRQRTTDVLNEAFRRDLVAMAGIAEVLPELSMRSCIASSSSPDRLRFTLGLTGLWDRFAPHVFSASMVERGKPAPDLFLYAAGRMGVDPGRCLVVEDSIYGVQAAVAAGMRAVGFVGGGHCDAGQGDRLRAAGAWRVIGRMTDLPQLASSALTR